MQTEMKAVSLLAALRLLTAPVLAVFAIALLWGMNRHQPARIWLGVVLGVNALLVAGGMAIAEGLFSSASTPVGYSLFFACFALPPLALYLMVRRVASPQVISFRDVQTFAPAGALALVLIGLSLVWIAPDGPYAVRGVWIGALLALHAIALTAFGQAARVIRQAPRWAQVLFGLFVVHWLFSGASGVAWIAGLSSGLYLEAASLAALLVFGLFAAGASVHLMAQHLPSVPQPQSIDPADAVLGEQLRTLFETDRLYLDPNLTLEALTLRVRATDRDVSRVLNTVLGGGYHEVVRRYRVQEAQRLLREHPEETVLAVLYDAGFNSKSAFHRAFSAEVGMTPSAYRRRHLHATVE